MFELIQTDKETKARRGRLTTAHGVIETPIFMPVGTQGTVKTLHPDDLLDLGSQIILGNTYHLNLRPGLDVIRAAKGLHQFSTWDKPILTDSGGFQVWSLAKLRKISEEGVQFANHLDGSKMMLSPETSMEIQATLGSDIAMLFDECPPYPCEEKYAADSLALTTRWAKRCKEWHEENASKIVPWMTEPSLLGESPMPQPRQLAFGIVQGSSYAELREQSAKELIEIGFDGYAVGGISVGEPEHEMIRAIDNAVPHLPADKPRYAMGLGTPPQMLEMIARGVDMFDCVMPTRVARHGLAFTEDGPIHIKNKEFEFDQRPLTEYTHPSVARFSRSYIRHLWRAKEMLALRLLSFHNLHFYLRLMQQSREAIEAGTFAEFKDAFITRYNSHKEQ
ncbi:tRNA-guanine transglycosylase [Rubritalea squalenifaciens DSM 18772]|uniref:Queuine tRNA-ribosyltransferase n=1 Tax=Rubritalea squalenifaciens DSM 18772 TaxID=1123071 RepID=A0A1M6KTX3_9BACT|nr:tRNA guanosine(34) transglycosylase Tgt [Rubritalea squalenifaciens]SHJ62415.1 tRNA-guanine transglycosylase [Rubritalea squalenifaciens DSM 18772]